jgi:hypothetical protein
MILYNYNPVVSLLFFFLFFLELTSHSGYYPTIRKYDLRHIHLRDAHWQKAA